MFNCILNFIPGNFLSPLNAKVKIYWEGDVDLKFCDPIKYGLTSDPYQLTEITPGKSISLAKEGKQIKRTEIMQTNKVRAIEITPAR